MHLGVSASPRRGVVESVRTVWSLHLYDEDLLVEVSRTKIGLEVGRSRRRRVGPVNELCVNPLRGRPHRRLRSIRGPTTSFGNWNPLSKITGPLGETMSERTSDVPTGNGVPDGSSRRYTDLVARCTFSTPSRPPRLSTDLRRCRRTLSLMGTCIDAHDSTSKSRTRDRRSSDYESYLDISPRRFCLPCTTVRPSARRVSGGLSVPDPLPCLGSFFHKFGKGPAVCRSCPFPCPRREADPRSLTDGLSIPTQGRTHYFYETLICLYFRRTVVVRGLWCLNT